MLVHLAAESLSNGGDKGLLAVYRTAMVDLGAFSKVKELKADHRIQ
jgi:hypothetical protein